MSGPYETERDARAAAISAGGPAEPNWSILSPGQRHKLLLNACAGAGVFLGEYDHRTTSGSPSGRTPPAASSPG